MCAIFGIVGPYDEKKAFEAFQTLSHRGPDAHGVITEPDLFLGHHRLSVIDPLPKANQPMSVGDALMLLNGEIYNYKQLRDTLGGSFATDSDTEVAVRAFERWGERIPRHLRGMYAMAIWKNESLHLFRDPFGKKPLFWTKQGDTFVFASEIKAILTLFPNLKPDTHALKSYLSYQSFISPHTLYPAIYQLEPGGTLRYEKGEVSIKVEDAVLVGPGDESVSEEKVEALLQESVSYRLVSDVALGALLSGGVDSSLVAAMAQRTLQTPLPTFTVGYEGYEKYDERLYADKVAAHIGSDHEAIVMNKADFFACHEAWVRHADEPLGDPAAVPLWFLGRHIAKRGIKVLLSGDGADELFFGYRPYFEMADIEKTSNLTFKNWLRNYFRAHYSPNREWEWYKRIFEGSVLYRSYAEIFTDLQQNMLLRQNVRDDTSLEWIDHYVKRFENPEGPRWFTYIDFKIQLAEVFLKKLDRVTMAHGIEARTPFLDRKLVQTLLRCNPLWRMGQSPKWLLKKIAQKYLPPDILTRKKKGFSYPYAEWLHEEKEGVWLMEANARHKLFKPDALRFIVEASRKKRFKHHFYALWHLMRWIESHEY
ncbi:asparagine synthase (glutamine-hydrolyzing) [Hydrogenimonas urashimensis]|uniref:asparagine synthase (glutamine-hydrolyzing) n=1 Tax=Hydrogenimonas urashimensis TaxID=2740515 RepID=UPI00191670AB|nr:asparagine synthase (glutamine-hydrolyzing) [Hydrogenimonas urashimensis]